MQYLIPKKKPAKKKAHIWLDGDTACSMVSGGSLQVRNYSVVDDIGEKQVCMQCKQQSRQRGCY